MKKRNVSINISVGLVVLSIVLLYVEIDPQVIVGLSMATLFFTIAQMLDSQVSFWSDDLQNQMDVHNNIGNFNLSPQNLLFFKILSKYQNPPKKQKIMHWLATILYSVAFIILFLAFVVPMEISEKLGQALQFYPLRCYFSAFGLWINSKSARHNGMKYK